MVGHTGNIEAAVKAVETIDHSLGRIVQAVRDAGGTLIVTADHGNAEEMWNTELNEPHTAHTCNPVPVIIVGDTRGFVCATEDRSAISHRRWWKFSRCRPRKR
jgi:2,3-bisphosphoglycerate-independent phosphoglycerate mutase